MTQQSGSGSKQSNTTSTSQTGQGGTSGAMSDMAEQAKEKAGQVADQAKQQATSRIASQKDRAAEGLTGVADALRQTSQQLNKQDQTGLTQYIDSAANQVDRVSNYIRGKDVNELLDDAEYYARREPALFVGGAFLLGLLGARFLKSSRPQPSSSGSYALASQQYSPTRGSYYGAGYERTGGSTSRYGATGGAANYGYSTTDADVTGPSGYTGTSGTTGANVTGTGTSATGARGTGTTGTTGHTAGMGTTGTSGTTSTTGTTGTTSSGTTTGGTSHTRGTGTTSSGTTSSGTTTGSTSRAVGTGTTGSTGTTGTTGTSGSTGSGTTGSTERRRNTEE